MISRRALSEAVAEQLRDFLRAHGFAKFLKARDEFVRALEDRQDRLALDIFKWPNAGSWNATFRVKVRYEAIERLRNAPNKSGDANHTCTLNRLIDNLYPKNIDHFQWQLAGLEDVAAAAPEMKARISAYAFPFFERFRDLDAVRQAMASEVGDWPVPTVQARAEVLLSCLALTGDAAGLSRWIPKLRAELQTVQGGAYRQRFESFLSRLASAFPQLVLV